MKSKLIEPNQKSVGFPCTRTNLYNDNVSVSLNDKKMQRREEKMKKNAVWSLIIVVLLSIFTGCSGGSKSESTKESSKPATSATAAATTVTKEVKLSLSIWGDDARKKIIEDQLVKFNQKFPHIKVEVQLIPFADYQQKMSIMLASNSAPDVVWLAERMIPQFLESKQLLDISSLKEDKDYNIADIFPSTMDVFKKEGKQYGISFTNPPKVIFYNKTLFKEKGLKNPMELYKEGKWTYDEMLKAAKAIADPAKGIYGLNLFGTGWKNWQDALMETIWAYGGDLFNPEGSKWLLNSPEGEQVFQMLSNAFFKDKVHLKPGDAMTFETGKIAMVRNNFSAAANVRKVAALDWDIAPMPEGMIKNAPTSVGVAGYVITGNSKYPKEALEVLKYMTGKEAMSDLASLFVPNRKSVLETDAFLKADPKPSQEGIKAALIDRMAKGVRVQPSHKNWQQIDVKVQTTIDLLFTQTATVKEVLSKMEKEVTPLLK